MIKNSEYYLLTIIPNFIFILILIFMVVILMTMKLMMVDTKEGIGCEKVISLIRVVKSKVFLLLAIISKENRSIFNI